MTRDKVDLGIAEKDLPPLFDKYFFAVQKDPKSKMFVPLAECYRKVGLYEKAIAVLKQGLQNHHDYITAYVLLAECYQDLEHHDQVYSLLSSLTQRNSDNFKLQKIFAKSCEELGYFDEALMSYKFQLFINPRAENISTKILELESKIGGETILIDSGKDINADFFEIKSLNENQKAPDLGSSWIEEKLERTNSTSIEDDEMTFNLVDLLVEKGEIEESRNLAYKMLELNPDDLKIKSKILELESIVVKEHSKREVLENLLLKFQKRFS